MAGNASVPVHAIPNKPAGDVINQNLASSTQTVVGVPNQLGGEHLPLAGSTFQGGKLGINGQPPPAQRDELTTSFRDNDKTLETLPPLVPKQILK
ncbi:unnamed protein product [Linum trigynum]|uniref:Uncharacterized protein n=1 Tax=Linum trigynum TaxID=586398 RepID=A0AAV2EMV5_9ROSI